MPYCIKCGRRVKPGANFCHHCGYRAVPLKKRGLPTGRVPTRPAPPSPAAPITRKALAVKKPVEKKLGAAIAAAIILGAVLVTILWIYPQISEKLSGGQEPTPTGSIEKNYTWSYGDYTWTLTKQIPRSSYAYYKNKPRVADYSEFVTYGDPSIVSLAGTFKEKAGEKGYGSYQEVSFVLAFIQCLPYTSDLVTTGYDEYPRYPIETLVDGGGDCEDTVILAAGILRAMNYGVVLLEFPNHMALGVAGGQGVYGSYFEVGGTKYFYCETTGDGWEIGEIPDEYRGQSATVVRI